MGNVFFPLLAVLFIGLKLTNVIVWTWWWVLAPVWGPMLFFLLLVALTAIVAIVADVFGKRG